MSDYPNIARLALADPDKLTSRQLQIHCIRQDYEKPARGSMHQVDKDARMAAAVPALLAHIDELYGQINDLKAKCGKQADMLAKHCQRRDEQDAEIALLRKERDAAQAETVRVAIDTSPAYAQLRDERDSARRERDEAMAKLDALCGTIETEPADDGVYCECDSCRDGGVCDNCEQYSCVCGGAR